MSKKLGLALGAGGARGAAHIGFLQALEEEGITPDYIAGCSMGAVVGGGYASGLSVEQLLHSIRELKAVDLLDPAGMAITKLGLFKGNKVRNILLEKIGDVDFKDLKIPFVCVAVDILSGRLVLLNEGSVTDALRASSAIPTVFRPVRSGDRLLIDGGVLCRVPVKFCKDLGADVVVAFDVLSNTGEPVDNVPNIVQKVLRVFDIMDYNQTQFIKRDFKDCYDLWLEPAMAGLSAYNVKDAERAYELGYQYSKKNVAKIKALLEE